MSDSSQFTGSSLDGDFDDKTSAAFSDIHLQYLDKSDLAQSSVTRPALGKNNHEVCAVVAEYCSPLDHGNLQ